MRIWLMALLLVPLILCAQQENPPKLLTTNKQHAEPHLKGWLFPYLGWRMQVGDNPAWADPSFNDHDWTKTDLQSIPFESPQIPAGSIVWLRLRIKNDSSFAQPLVLRVNQSGASEIYLDGKLIHRLGVVSHEKDSSLYVDPSLTNLSFPLFNDSSQVLAVRFLHIPVNYPLFFNNWEKGFFPQLAKLDNAVNDYSTRASNTQMLLIAIVFGVASLLGLLFLSLYFFFRTQRVNLLFSLCTFSLAGAVLCIYLDAINSGYPLPLDNLPNLPASIYLFLLLYCIYTIFNQPRRVIFWIIGILCLLLYPLSYLISGDMVSSILAIFVSLDAIRITSSLLKKGYSAGARIMQVASIINLLFFIILILTGFSVLPYQSVNEYVPFAYLLIPLSLAIFIGYSFGTTSQSLSQKLNEVQELSAEKELILARQKDELEKQVRERTEELHQSLNDLKTTQTQLIQSEKMASLGELTAGIAHEIQNPLNFVNNFAELNTELSEEVKILLSSYAKASADTKLKSQNPTIDTGELDELLTDILQNNEKIVHHGKRAESIVKGMLQHSRSSSGKKEPTDINALADEYLKLAFHGLRAKDNNFNATLITEYDETLPLINVIPQDIGRVLLNIFTNAFYAINEKKKNAPADYTGTLKIQTQNLLSGDTGVSLRILDNGTGIPSSILTKVFQPFFTTKPTGQGTGLGLSLSYDIIKAHGGELTVETTEGEGTNFMVTLPA